MEISLGAHRGLGSTDSEYALSDSFSHSKPAENTILSMEKALDLEVTFLEFDVVLSADEIVVIHSNKLSDHVFDQKHPSFVGDCTLDLLKKLRVGPRQDGIIPTLTELLEFCSSYKKDIFFNIEIKDTKGTNAPKFVDGQKALIELLPSKIKGYEDKIILSSFSVFDLVEAERIMPHVKRAMLFDTNKKKERPIYSLNQRDKSNYLMFTPSNIRFVLDQVSIEYLHPEINTITDETMKTAREFNLGLNSWALNERHPYDHRHIIYNFLDLSKKYNVSCGIITDHLAEMKKLILDYRQR